MDRQDVSMAATVILLTAQAALPLGLLYSLFLQPLTELLEAVGMTGIYDYSSFFMPLEGTHGTS